MLRVGQHRLADEIKMPGVDLDVVADAPLLDQFLHFASVGGPDHG